MPWTSSLPLTFKPSDNTNTPARSLDASFLPISSLSIGVHFAMFSKAVLTFSTFLAH
jgi:hypothetical protein